MSETTPVVPVGRRRFWGTVLCFALANLAVWVGYDHHARSRLRTRLEVQQSAPAGGTLVSGRPVFWWTFNLDVAPPPPGAPAPGVVSPPVAGKWNWDNARTLSFVPDAPLPRASQYTLTLAPDRLRSIDGFRLAEPHVVVVHTAPLDVTGVRQVAYDEQDRVALEIAFNDDVLPAELASHLSIESGENKPVKFTIAGEAPGHTLRVITDPMPTTAGDDLHAQARVTLSAGLSGRAGPLGLALPYHRDVAIGADLRAESVTSGFPRDGETLLAVQFNNPVDLAVLKRLLSVEPAVPFTLTSGYRGVELHGAFQPATRYAITIARPPEGVARNRCPRPDTLSVFVPDRGPSVWFENTEGYLGSAGNRTILAHAVNVTDLRVSLTRIYDNNLIVWRNQSRRYFENPDPYARPIARRDLKLPALKNRTQDVPLSLDELLPASAPRDGVYQISLEPLTSTQAWGDDEDGDEDDRFLSRGGRGYASAMVTLSDVGITAKQGRTETIVWATSLRTAQPQPGVRVRLFSNKNQPLGTAVTDDAGLAHLVPAPTAAGEEPTVILADRPDAPPEQAAGDGHASTSRDLTWLDLRTSRLNWGGADVAGEPYLRNGHEAFVYTERGVYRPGETVHLRAIVRDADGHTPASFPVRWQFRRPDLHDWKSVGGMLASDGTVALDLPLPDDLPTGHWSVGLSLGAQDAREFGSASFQVEDFVPNRMTVALKLKDEQAGTGEPVLAAGDAPVRATVQADYLFGRPVTDRPARLVARIDPISFAPAQWSGWTFDDAARTLETLDGQKITGHRVELPEQPTDEHGSAAFEFELASLLEPSEGSAAPAAGRPAKRTPVAHSALSYRGPWRMALTASVIETGGRAVTATHVAQVDPQPWHVGVRASGATAGADAATPFQVALVRHDGSVAAEDAELESTVFREQWNNSLVFEGGRYRYHSTRVLETVKPATLFKTAAGKGTLDVQLNDAGAYVLRVRHRDSGAVTSVSFYVGADAWADNVSREDPEKLEVVVRPIPDGSAVADAIRTLDVARLATAVQGGEGSPRVGGSAQVLVRSPFAGRLLLNVETDDVVSSQVVDMPASSVAVPIDLPAACRPNAYVTATVIRPVDPSVAWRVHRAFGVTRIAIDNSDRKLSVALDAPPEMHPAGTLPVRARVTDPAGNPVEGAAVTVMAVDEGIEQLTRFTTPDPFAYFMRNRSLGVTAADVFSQLMPEAQRPDSAAAPGGDKGPRDPRHTTPVKARRVVPVALVSETLHTDAQGIARADFSVPAFTGRLRLMAVGSSDELYGSAESATLVRSELLVQSSWPRFAAPQDKFLVPLVLFNNTKQDGRAAVTIRVKDGPLKLSAAGKTQIALAPFSISAGGQSTQFVQAFASDAAGVSHVSLSATMSGYAYEEDVEIPVRPASPPVTLGGYAVAKPNQPAAIDLPTGMLAGTAKLEVKATPWPALSLPQGLDSLERYPYGCLEQTTSTLFPLVYLPDVGRQIAPGLFEQKRVNEKVQAGITRLIGMQTSDGGLAMWPTFRSSWPWGSVYAAHFLVEAQPAGHEVPPEFRRQLLGYVRGLLAQSSDDPETLQTQAYACYVLALAGKPERAAMSRLDDVIRAAGEVRPDSGQPAVFRAEAAGQARLHLAAAWLAAGRRDRAEAMIPQTLPEPRTGRTLAGTLGSPVRDRAILLDTLLAVDAEHPALPHLARQLADAGRRGEWRSTQDTAFAVLALGRYLRDAKSHTPYDSAQLLLDDAALADAKNADPLLWSAGDANRPCPSGGTLQVKIGGPADSVAHVEWLETGVPLHPPAGADHGLRVRRRLLDSTGRPLASNRVTSGDLIRVELTVAAETPLANLVIDDLLPAGLEIENPRLATTAAGTDADAPADEARHGSLFFASRSDLRDDRLILMGALTAGGEGTYAYTVRAVTPGTFVLPPVHAECMYDSGINSLSGAGVLEVSPAGASRIADVRE